MSFVSNDGKQISLDDKANSLTEREKKLLEKSWAKNFSEIVFPSIDEEPFSVLYEDNKATRPNTPVNVILGSLSLKELHGLSDDALMKSLIFDVRFQYALHTTSMDEQPLSYRTLSRFRERCLNYEIITGRDLIKECILNLSDQLDKVMGINNNSKRMNSMMVASNIKRMSRLELLYTCVSNMVNLLSKNTELVDNLKHYLDPADANKIILRFQSSGGQLQKTVPVLDRARAVCPNFTYQPKT